MTDKPHTADPASHPELAERFIASLKARDLGCLGGLLHPAVVYEILQSWGTVIPLNPSADAMAGLTWEARRLTAEQVKLARRKAEAMRALTTPLRICARF